MTHHDDNWKKSRNEFFAACEEFGSQQAAGVDARPKLAFAVVQAAHGGLLDTKTKDSEGKDDAARVYDAHMAGFSAKALHTENGQKANTSKVRQLIEFGLIDANAPAVLASAADMRKRLAGSKVKVKPAFDAYVDVARARNKSTYALTDVEIEAAVRRGEADEKNAADIIEAAKGELEKLADGKRKDGVAFTSPELREAIASLGNIVVTLAASGTMSNGTRKRIENSIAELRACGINVDDQTSAEDDAEVPDGDLAAA